MEANPKKVNNWMTGRRERTRCQPLCLSLCAVLIRRWAERKKKYDWANLRKDRKYFVCFISSVRLCFCVTVSHSVCLSPKLPLLFPSLIPSLCLSLSLSSLSLSLYLSIYLALSPFLSSPTTHTYNIFFTSYFFNQGAQFEAMFPRLYLCLFSS